MSDGRCVYCGGPLAQPLSQNYRGIHGWERMGRAIGRAGGGSDIYLRKPTGEWACPVCIGRLLAGVAVDQTELGV